MYHFNNKYTYKSAQPIGGILDISNEDIQKNSLYFLIYDWEFYPDKLLSPKDFINGNSGRYMEYLNIGERTSMTEKKAFGRGTYRLNIKLPQKTDSYMIELPEIFNSYKLYIDNKLILEMGNPEKGENSVQNRAAVFQAEDMVQIIIAVNCNCHFYSGMVYPPTFGTPLAVNLYRGIKLFINTAIISTALLCFFLSIWIGIRMNQKDIRLFSLLILAAMGYTSYQLIRCYFADSGELIYTIEIGSYYAMYALMIMMHNRQCARSSFESNVSCIISWIVCIAAICFSVFSKSFSIEERRIFSDIFYMYKWSAAVYIMLSVIYSAFKQKKFSHPLLFSSVFFAVSIIFDRIYPVYEPIYGGWFSEISGTLVIIILGYTLWEDISSAYSFRLKFDEQQRQLRNQIQLQKEHYDRLSEAVHETRKLRHDMRQHLRVLKGLAGTNNIDELSQYICELDEKSEISQPLVLCNNHLIDALLQYYGGMCHSNGIRFEVRFASPEVIKIQDTDLSIIFGNLLENAIEACMRIKDSSIQKIISVNGVCSDTKLKFKITNSFDGYIKEKNGKYYSAKRDEIGIGIQSINSVIEKYDGIMDIQYDEHMFSIAVIVPLMSI